MTVSKFPAVKRRLSLVALAVIGTISSSWVIAQDSTTGPYIGANVGSTRASFNTDTINQTLTGQGFTVRSRSEDNSSAGYKVFGGYQLNRNLAVEGGYFDLGRFNYGLVTAPIGLVNSGAFNGETRVRGLNLDLVGMLPLSDQFSVFGRVGAAYAQSRSNYNRAGTLLLNNASTRRNETNLKVGLGIQYAITEALAVRAEVERYRISDPIRNRGHIDMASIGLVYNFGARAQTPVAPAFVPMVSVPPPPPPPAPVIVAPRPPPPPPPVVAAPAPMPAPVFEPPVRPARQGRN